MLKSRGHRITKQGIPLRSIYYTLQLEEELPVCDKHSASTVFFHSYISFKVIFTFALGSFTRPSISHVWRTPDCCGVSSSTYGRTNLHQLVTSMATCHPRALLTRFQKTLMNKSYFWSAISSGQLAFIMTILILQSAFAKEQYVDCYWPTNNLQTAQDLIPGKYLETHFWIEFIPMILFILTGSHQKSGCFSPRAIYGGFQAPMGRGRPG